MLKRLSNFYWIFIEFLLRYILYIVPIDEYYIFPLKYNIVCLGGMDGIDMQTYLQTNGHDNNNQVGYWRI